MEHENEHFKKFSDIFNQINFEPALMNDQNANAGIIYDHYLDEHQTKELEKSAEILREKIRWSYYALGQISAQKLRLKKSSEKTRQTISEAIQNQISLLNTREFVLQSELKNMSDTHLNELRNIEDNLHQALGSLIQALESSSQINSDIHNAAGTGKVESVNEEASNLFNSLEHKLTGDQWYLQQICHNSGLSFDSHSNTLENAIAIFGRVQLLSDSGSNFEPLLSANQLQPFRTDSIPSSQKSRPAAGKFGERGSPKHFAITTETVPELPPVKRTSYHLPIERQNSKGDETLSNAQYENGTAFNHWFNDVKQKSNEMYHQLKQQNEIEINTLMDETRMNVPPPIRINLSHNNRAVDDSVEHTVIAMEIEQQNKISNCNSTADIAVGVSSAPTSGSSSLSFEVLRNNFDFDHRVLIQTQNCQNINACAYDDDCSDADSILTTFSSNSMNSLRISDHPDFLMTQYTVKNSFAKENSENNAIHTKLNMNGVASHDHSEKYKKMTNLNWLLLKEEEQKMAHESGDTNIYGISARNNAIDNGELLEWKWQYPTLFPFSSTATSMTNDLFLKLDTTLTPKLIGSDDTKDGRSLEEWAKNVGTYESETPAQIFTSNILEKSEDKNEDKREPSTATASLTTEEAIEAVRQSDNVKWLPPDILKFIEMDSDTAQPFAIDFASIFKGIGNKNIDEQKMTETEIDRDEFPNKKGTDDIASAYMNIFHNKDQSFWLKNNPHQKSNKRPMNEMAEDLNTWESVLGWKNILEKIHASGEDCWLAPSSRFGLQLLQA